MCFSNSTHQRSYCACLNNTQLCKTHGWFLLVFAPALLLACPQVPTLRVKTHLLPGAGGASGVAESLVAFAKMADLLVVGSRGMGALKRCAPPLLGQDSSVTISLGNLNVKLTWSEFE